ncbi:MAG: extracellular solute-binding protein, partial [Acidobacteria bacterium]|nr:extracellular solute-binding protein [Acidobacteriota bacterium]
AVAHAFMKRYPNVKLEPFSYLKPPAGTELGAAESDMMMAMAGGVAPDVLTVNFRQSETFISQGFLLPLDKYFVEWAKAPDGQTEMDRLIPSRELWDVIKRPGRDNVTHTWFVPQTLYLGALLFRKDVLRNAGLDPDHLPQTWDDFFRICLQVTDPRKSIYGFRFDHSWALTAFIRSMNGEVMACKPGTQDWYAAYTDEGSLTATLFAWKLQRQPWGICPLDDSHFELDPDKLTGACPHGHTWTKAQLEKKKLFFRGVCAPNTDLWGQGKQAYFLYYIGEMEMSLVGSIDPSLIGFAPVPKSPLGIRKSEINAHMLAINGTVKDPAKIATAWAFIRFSTSEEARRITTQVLVDGGYAKYVNPLWLRRFGYTAYLRESPPGWEETFKTALATAHPEPYGKNAQQIYVEMDNAWDKIKLMDRPDRELFRRMLRDNAAQTNEKLIGRIPRRVEAQRNNVALIVVLFSGLLFAGLIRFTMSTYGTALKDEPRRKHVARRRLLLASIILAPALIGVLLFQYVPLLRGSVIAFQDYSLLGPHPFVGVSNFGKVLYNEYFWLGLLHSAEYAAISLGLGFFLPVILALLLHEVPVGSLFYRVVYFLPAVTSGIVILLLWKQLYDPNPYGVINQAITGFNGFLAQVHLPLTIPQQQFLNDPKLALFWVLLPGIWAHVGPGCIIYLAAMKQVPEEYYEAADVDGAGFFTKFRLITIPFLKPLLIINFIGACIGAFKAFEPVWIMTNGGPAGATRVLGLEVWRNAFVYLKYGYATSMGWLLASLLIGFTIFQLRYLSKVQFRLAKSD